ncbi:apoptosis-inducing factor Aif1 [Schizosaccharomyces japonicus yFS275]|uniref:Apoptosis-inducing factor Aif1 n=1 Tax=Schizosaccharomyces japonicus (strain yFS275 / FY16936) TaxID=402676 RepID=B6JZH6_SCHJY|nr:apoptosis-inducing factor Aif1 [Schizosaccharomyces japonicus yFS275]EEB06944.1 apoptosis-inducing factor Aif1 [Schizosaccharomyces japonicus yFS275]
MTLYKLSFDPAAVSQNGSKVEAKVEGTSASVLLLRHKDQFYATSSKCSHYGAPLANGCLNGNGSIVCPWHGAAYNIETGDIEDSPALNALRRFPVVEKAAGELWIDVPDTDGQHGLSLLTPEGCWRNRASEVYKKPPGTSTPTKRQVCIVGGGQGAAVAIEALRENGYTDAITVFTKESVLPYDRPKLSKSLMHDMNKIGLQKREHYEALDIVFHFSSEVNKIDVKNKIIYYGEQGDEQSYDYVILATGGVPRALPIEGADANNVYLLRSQHDAARLAAATTELPESAGRKNIVIVGSSFIGLELSVVLKDHNLSVIGMESVPFEKAMGRGVGNVVRALHEENGVRFYMNAGVSEFERSDPTNENVDAVILKDGTKLPADIVILAIGVKPDLSYLGDAVPLESDGGIAVDEHCRVLGLEDAGVYAVGDIAHAPFSNLPVERGGKTRTRIEHWDVAGNLARVAANHIAFGKTSSFTTKSFTPFFWTAQGKQLRYCGNTSAAGYDDIVLQGSFADNKFTCFYAKGEKIVAVASMMTDPAVTASSQLLLSGKMPSKSELQAGLDVRTIPL